MQNLREQERGLAQLAALYLVLVFAAFAIPFLSVTVEQTKETTTAAVDHQVFYIADAAMNDALVNLLPSLGPGDKEVLGTKVAPITFQGGSYWVTGADNGNGTYTLVANARYAGQSAAIETIVAKEHPLRNFAVFAGNRSGAGASFEVGGSNPDQDIINGDVHINDDITVSGHGAINGDANATGSVFGGSVSGTSTSGASNIAPPDLRAMDYRNTADFQISDATPWDGDGELPESDPRHIFVKEFRNDLAGDVGFKFSNTNFFLGDPHEGSNIAEISVPAAGNNKVYHVDGNLWIEPMGTTSEIIKSPKDGTVITVVVTGNIYIADNFSYDDYAKDGVLFIAMSDGESYTDLNGNNEYDVGETILHDDGDGIYEGNTEGSGNVYFGDPNGGPLGHVNAFIYAENHFEDYVAESDDDPLPLEVTGFMSAGEQVRIRRTSNGKRAEMRVNYDDRPDLDLPGFPAAGSSGRQGVLFWRTVAAEK